MTSGPLDRSSPKADTVAHRWERRWTITKIVVGVAATGLAVVLTFAFIFGWYGNDGGGGAAAGDSDEFVLARGQGAPREYLYLDSPRVEAYLSQLEGGTATQDKVSRSASDALSGELAVGPATGSRSRERQRSLERTVTPTASSRFFALTGRLDALDLINVLPALPAPRQGGVMPPAAVARFLESYRTVGEGEFVRFDGRVELPGFMRLYQTVVQSPANSPVAKEGATIPREVGPNPRFPMTVVVKDDPQEGPDLRIIMPGQYSALATEPSLFYGRLRILGKVIYRIHRGSRSFRDLQAYSRFRPVADREVPQRLLDRLKLRRSNLRRELRDYRVVRAPSAVILPVAIYK
jgi:hypothetical protein